MAGLSVRYGKLCEKRLLHMMTGPVSGWPDGDAAVCVLSDREAYQSRFR